MKRSFLPSFCLALGLGACAVSSQERLSIPLYFEGKAQPGPIAVEDGLSVELLEAKVAFGPLYLCPGKSAGELCDTARAEWLGTSVVDVLGSSRSTLGELSGMSGSVGSWMVDYGIVSLLTQDSPYVAEAAETLGGSVTLRGLAHLDDTAAPLPFRAALRVETDASTTPGIPALQSPLGSGFGEELSSTTEGVLVRIDAETWVRGLRVEHFLQDEPCRIEAPVTCRGSVEQTCDAGGALLDRRDCSEIGLFCVPDQGCQSELVVSDDSELYRALLLGVTNQGRPKISVAP